LRYSRAILPGNIESSRLVEFVKFVELLNNE